MADPTKARDARRLYADQRIVRDLNERGWLCWKTGPQGDEPECPAYLQIYATNHLGETYRVVGWEHDTDGALRPTLAGGNGHTFTGLFNYVFTRGPR